MTKNPLFNALAASFYISIVASIMYYGPKLAGKVESVVVPIAMISLFTFSAAVMGYLFLLQPLRMYLDGDKQGGVSLFIKTLGIFGAVTVLLLIGLFFRTFF